MSVHDGSPTQLTRQASTHAVRAHAVPLALDIHERGSVVPPKLVHEVSHDDGRRRRDAAFGELCYALDILLQCTRTAPPQFSASSINSVVRGNREMMFWTCNR